MVDVRTTFLYISGSKGNLCPNQQMDLLDSRGPNDQYTHRAATPRADAADDLADTDDTATNTDNHDTAAATADTATDNRDTATNTASSR
jgi:hypothetical protein